MADYNWDKIFEQAEKIAHFFTNRSELADALDVPRSTFIGALKRRGVTFADLLLGEQENVSSEVDTLQLQNRLLAREISHLKKQIGKNEWWGDVVREAAASLCREPDFVPALNAKEEKESQTGVLLLGDIHMGQYTDSELVGVFGEYNSEIASARVRYVFNSFAENLKSLPFPIAEVVVVGGGDWVEHAHMRPGHEMRVDEGVIKQTLRISDLVANGMHMLSGNFPKVRFVGVPGNHGRVTADPRLSFPSENFDYLSYHLVKRALGNHSNISWQIPESWYTYFKIYDLVFFTIHGEGIKSYSGFPWYGATRAARQYVAMFRNAQRRLIKANDPQTIEELKKCMIVPDYALLFHFHQQTEWEAPDIQNLANGAIPGVSEYGAKDIKTINRPSQKMFLVDQDGITWKKSIRLDQIF